MFEKIQEMLAESLNLPLEKITLEAKIVDDLGADSLDAVELISRLEDEYNVTVEDDDIENMVTVGDLVNMLEKLVKQTKDCGIYEDTNFVITSDHGQIDVDKIFRPNVVLQKNGFITLDQNNNLLDWDCWCASADASAQIHFKNPSDTILKDKVYSIFNKLSQQNNSGISAVYTTDETKSKFKLDGDFSLVIETDGSTIFSNEWTGEVLSKKEKRTGTHGHNPNLGPCPIFIGYGPAFKKGATVLNAKLVDGAPTYAHILGTNLPQADGRILFELLSEK